MELENTSVEMQEVAEPVESVETQEVAEPVQTPEENPQSGKTEADAAFAKQRRELQEANRRIAELEANEKAREEAFTKLTGSKDGVYSAIAENIGAEPEDVLATFEAEQEVARKDLELESLRQQLKEVQAEKEMQTDLVKVQAIDPTINSLEDLGEEFISYTAKGLSAEEAYWACKAKREATQMKAPKAPGKANEGEPEKKFFTEDEVNAMTPSQQKANYQKILESMKHW